MFLTKKARPKSITATVRRSTRGRMRANSTMELPREWLRRGWGLWGGRGRFMVSVRPSGSASREEAEKPEGYAWILIAMQRGRSGCQARNETVRGRHLQL